MSLDVKKFDLVFFVDGTSLIEGDLSVFDTFNETAKVRLFAPEVDKVNEHYKGIQDPAAKSAFKGERIGRLNTLVNQKKIAFLNGTQEDRLDYKLIEILLKRYFTQSVLIVSNCEQKAAAYLPLVPVYEAFGQCLAVVKLTADGFVSYEYECYEQAMEKLVKAPVSVAPVAPVNESKPTDTPAPVAPVDDTPVKVDEDTKADVNETPDVKADETVVVADENTDKGWDKQHGCGADKIAAVKEPTAVSVDDTPVAPTDDKDETIAPTDTPVDDPTDDDPAFTPVGDDEFDF